jgi:hypothetical protein
VFFHSTSCNAFVFGVQDSQRSPKLPSKTIQLTNNGPATKTSSFLQLPNDGHVHFEQLCIPTTTASIRIQADNDHHSNLNDVTASTTTAFTGLQADNDDHSTLNDVTNPQAFSALTATTTATMTQVLAKTTAITKVIQNKLDECFLHPAKTSASNATNKSESILLHALFGSAITTARIHTPSHLLLYIHDNPAI